MCGGRTGGGDESRRFVGQDTIPMSLTSDPATILDKLGEAPIRAATQRKSWTNQK
jgi:hypothetical protein